MTKIQLFYMCNMGIKAFSRFIENYAPTSTETVDMNVFQNKRVAIDVSIFMHKYAYRQGSTPETCAKRFLEQDRNYKLMRTKTIYVFDGIPLPEKKPIINKRARRRERIIVKQQQQGEQKKNNINVTRQHYDYLKKTLKMEGIDFIIATNDAEKTCAWLCKSGIVDIVITDDYDALAFGATHIVRNANKKYMEYISKAKILDDTKFTETEFVKFCILSGCDFTSSDLRLGMKSAYDCVSKKEYDKYEHQIEHIQKYFTYNPEKVPIMAIHSNICHLIVIVSILRCLVHIRQMDEKMFE